MVIKYLGAKVISPVCDSMVAKRQAFIISLRLRQNYNKVGILN